MKKTLFALLAVIIAATLSVSVFATDYVLDFSAMSEEGYTLDGDVYTLDLTKEANPKALVSTVNGLEFQFKANGGWDMFTIVAKDKYTESGLNGIGLKFRYDTGVEITLMMPGQNWGSASATHPQYRVLHDLPDSKGVFNDNNWHTVSVAIADGRLSVKFDGNETILAVEDYDNVGFNAEEYGKMIDLVGNGGEVYVAFGYNAATDSYQVKSAEKSAAPSVETADFTAVALVAVAAAAACVLFAKKH